MATLCKLCDKKIGFFDGSYSISDQVVCENCHKAYEKVLDSISENETFHRNLAEFKRVFEGKEALDQIVVKLESLYEAEMAEKQRAAEEDKKESQDEDYDTEDNEPVKEEKNCNIGPFENQDLVYTIDGVRGRHIDIYKEKVVITTKVTIGSLITHNATDGEKTIYYSDCIGVQFKPSKFTIGYLQLETASSNGNNKNSNFFSENTFTYDTTVISNERMTEVANYVKSRVDAIKKGATIPAEVNNNISVADELLKLKQLLDIGVLTQEEFDKEKIKLLNR
jgi:hypothetical protein